MPRWRSRWPSRCSTSAPATSACGEPPAHDSTFSNHWYETFDFLRNIFAYRFPSRTHPFWRGPAMNYQPVGSDRFRPGGQVLPAAQRNRVLRNTYWLLALSMFPTVLGAWLGVATGFAQAMTPGIGLIVFFAGAFGFMFAIEK